MKLHVRLVYFVHFRTIRCGVKRYRLTRFIATNQPKQSHGALQSERSIKKSVDESEAKEHCKECPPTINAGTGGRDQYSPPGGGDSHFHIQQIATSSKIHTRKYIKPDRGVSKSPLKNK